MNIYDLLKPPIRRKLQSSNFNICAACVQSAGSSMAEQFEFIERAERQLTSTP